MREQDLKLVDISAELVKETAKGWLLTDGVVEDWVPKSLVENNKDGTFTMPTWIAKSKGFM